MNLTTGNDEPSTLQVGELNLDPLTQSIEALYRAEYAEQARKLCLLGVDERGLADFFNTDINTLTRWRHLHDALDTAINRGRLEADANVVHALYRRAVGYEVPDVHISRYQGKVTQTKTTRHIPPSAKACMFWLSSRMPGQWGEPGTQVSACE